MSFSYFLMRAMLISSLLMITAQAKQIIDPYESKECPKLSLSQATQIIQSGKMIDAIPNYVAFAQHTDKAQSFPQVTSLRTHKPYEDSDGNVLCSYELLDSKGRIIYELSLKPQYGINTEPPE